MALASGARSRSCAAERPRRESRPSPTLIDHPADGLAAGAAAGLSREPWHRRHRFLEWRRPRDDGALQVCPVLHIDRGAIGLGQAREDVRDVLLDVAERPAVRADRLERELAAAAEEAAVRQTQQILAREPVDRLARRDPCED